MITKLTEEIKALEIQLKGKKTELQNLLRDQKNEEGKKYPLSSFIGESYQYDRPNKWNDPRNGTFTEEYAARYEYLDFNGLVAGEELNKRIYGRTVFEKGELYATFVIPEEDYEEEGAAILPLEYAYELLTFKVS